MARSLCGICLDDVRGADRTWRWTCGHEVHFRCIARDVESAALPCFMCRAPPHYGANHSLRVLVGELATWPDMDEPMPRDRAPAPMTTVIPLCCNRVVADGSHFEEADDRRMRWAPYKVNGGTWQLGWTCMQCQFQLDAPTVDHPSRPRYRCRVHGECTLLYDLKISDGSPFKIVCSCSIQAADIIEEDVPYQIDCDEIVSEVDVFRAAESIHSSGGEEEHEDTDTFIEETDANDGADVIEELRELREITVRATVMEELIELESIMHQ